MTDNERLYSNFIQDIIDYDIENKVYNRKIHTRFPPEPNGYLHIGHAKSICLNFMLAKQNDGICNLRFDDTNPSKEEVEYVDSIMEDVKWLGFSWDDRLYYASGYFDKLYEFAVELIKKGKAYVCDLNADEIREYRGTLTEAGKNSPYRDRSVEENLDLFNRMKNGEFSNGEKVLRAKIDMASPNLNMRDPVIYRILKVEHHRTKDKWCIYPMYDYAHPLSDYLEGITHSVCTLEFEAHRPLYEWFLKALDLKECPKQIEFARLNLNYTVMSKRKLLELVKNKYVDGWDDPRMPTISGLRRRGYTPSSIRDFCVRIGISKAESMVDINLLEHCIREELNKDANRCMVVLRPLKLVIDNYPDDLVEEFDAENNPEDEGMGKRKVKFSKVVYIERDDFMENPPSKYYRLAVGKEVRLKHAYFVKCESFVKDDKTGEILEIHCTYDEKTRGGNAEDGRKVKGTIQWVSEKYAVPTRVNLYSNLFNVENPDDDSEGKSYKDYLNPNSLEIIDDAIAEFALKDAKIGTRYQFLRTGYFILDDKKDDKLVFNRIVGLKDSWAKISKNN